VQTSIIYLEPFSGRNLRAFGYDMYSETIRRLAMELARDSGEATLSGKVRLKQETNENAQAGVLMYVPIYRNDRPKETAQQRQAALTGWAYSPYRMNDLMSGILRDWENREGEAVDLHIYDGQLISADALLFDSKPAHTPDPHSLFYQHREIRFNGHPWSLIFDRAANISRIGYADAWATLLGGLTLSILMFGLMLSRINTSAIAARIANELTEELRQREIQLQESELRYRTVADFTSDCEFWIMPDGVLKYVSPSCEQISGYSPEEFYADPGLLTRRIHPDDQALYAEHTQHMSAQGVPQPIDFRYCTKSGKYRWLSHACRPVFDTSGKSLGRRTSNRDITERKQMEEQVSNLAFYDALTQLPNRRLLHDRLDQSIAACGRSGNYGALIFLDLDNFKPLNDSQGHAVGDLLLVEVANRLKNCVRDADTVSRFGGDEFVVMLHELDHDKTVSASQAGLVAEKIRLALSRPYLLTINPNEGEKGLIEHLCSASIGVTLFNHQDACHEDILTWADTAMYQAKEAGRNRVKFYSTS
jgi:diguanylate cyclase (GGDEF)-like protein/PAS domain S-box-containing protein